MSTHGTTSRTHNGVDTWRGVRRSLVSPLLSGMLLALFLSTPVFASSMTRLTSLPSLPSLPQYQARAGVSVVRLIVTYTAVNTAIKPTSPSPTTLLVCTGVGIILKSWTSMGATDQNNWLLTDGKLVDPLEASCVPGSVKAVLSSIQVINSNEYSQSVVTHPVSLPTTIATLTDVTNIHCQTDPCSNGAALVAFATTAANTLPFVDLATTDLKQVAGLELTQSTDPKLLPPASLPKGQTVAEYEKNLQAYQTTSIIAPNTGPATPEFGVPYVNQAGELVGMHINALATFTASDITALLHTIPAVQATPTHINAVHDNWVNGILDYYQGPSHYAAAHTAFQKVVSENAQFQGAQAFVAASLVGGSQPASTSGTGGSTPLGGKLTLLGFSIPWLWLILAGGAVLLILLIVFLTVLFSRTRHKRAFDQEWQEAQRMSDTQIKAIRAQEQRQRPRAIVDKPTLVPESQFPGLQYQGQSSAASAPSGMQQSRPPLAAGGMPPAPPLVRQSGPAVPFSREAVGPEWHCPQCNEVIDRGSTFCPFCGTQLSPSDSGLHARFRIPPVASEASLENQPTQEIGASLAKQNNSVDMEATSPDLSRHEMTRVAKEINHGFVVVTRTNPGRKRQHKPNEDSLFAAQGSRKVNAPLQLQQVGLFVIADGMGGHANGQDASRLAIQTIANYIVPRISSNVETGSDALRQLLLDGVRAANKAVHERNMEQHADMGTTMTAALVVDMPSTMVTPDAQSVPCPVTAFVANVGDSRTYLYRDGRLRKVTQDHSVVASLVQAGLIEEDDIYTHPKRNQIYRSLGEKLDIEVDTFVQPLCVNDRLLLCSDGLWDMVRDPKIEQVVRSHAPDGALGDSLIQAALDGGGEDNVSVIVVHIPEESKRTGRFGIQLIDKPDTVQVQMPQ